LGALHVFGFAGRQGVRGINELGAVTRLKGLSKVTAAVVPQVAMFGGMMGAHELEGRLGLRTVRVGETAVSDVLGSMFGMQVGLAIGTKFMGRGWANWRREMEARTDPFAKRGEAKETKWNFHSAPAFSTASPFPGISLAKGRGSFLARARLAEPWRADNGEARGGGGGNGLISGFKVGEVNSTEVIRAATSINNQPVEVLEARLREAGLLGRTESLLEVMAADNDYVLTRNLTHQRIVAAKNDLAKASSPSPVHLTIPSRREGGPLNFMPVTTHSGRRFLYIPIISEESQRSPFEDPSSSPAASSIPPSRLGCAIINQDTGTALDATNLQWKMIRDVGFYGGRESSRRLEPSAILEVFDFLVRESALTLRPFRGETAGIEADLPEVASRFGITLPPSAQRSLESWAAGILAGEEGAWSPYRQFLSVNFQVSRIVGETIKRFDQAFSEAGDSALYQDLGIEREMRDEVMSALYLVFTAETMESGTNLGFLNFIDPQARVAFDENGLGQVLQHPLRNFLASRRGETLSSDVQDHLIHEAAGGDLVLLSILALLASRGQSWAIEGLRRIEEERETALQSALDYEALQAPLALELNLGWDGQGYPSSGDALMMQAHALAMQSEVVRLLGGSEETLPPGYVASLVERVRARDYQALVSLAFLAARFTEAQENIEGLARAYDAGRYEQQIIPGSYSSLFFLAGAKSARALRELAQATEIDSEAAQLMATLVKQDHAEARLAFARRDLSRLFPQGPLSLNDIWWAHYYWQAGNEWSGRRLASDDLTELRLGKIAEDPSLYAAELSRVILTAQAGNTLADALLEGLHERSQLGGGSPKARAARKGLQSAVSSDSAALEAMADLALRKTPWAVDALRRLDTRAFSARAFHDPRVLSALLVMEELGHPGASEALAQLYGVLFKAAAGMPVRQQDYPSQPELAVAVSTIPPPERAQRYSQWARLTLEHYGAQHHLAGLEEEVRRGLDPAGMLAIPHTRERVREIASALGVPMNHVIVFANEHRGDGIEKIVNFTGPVPPEALTWMILQHLSNQGEKDPQAFVDDTARLLRDLDDAATDPQAAAEAAKREFLSH
jgi:hypothetical protein